MEGKTDCFKEKKNNCHGANNGPRRHWSNRPPQTITHSRSIPMIHGAMGIFAPTGTNKLLISLANGLENVSYSEVHPFVFQQYSGFRKPKIYLPPPISHWLFYSFGCHLCISSPYLRPIRRKNS